MKDAIELFVTLGERLRDFGHNDATQRVIACACEANGWFTPAEICRAISALSAQMLRRDALCAWLKPYAVPVAVPRRVLVVMAGNIPLVGFFDLLCVLASGHRCLIKPSSKDSVLMEYIINLLHDIAPETAVELYDGNSPVDAVIATGGDDANRYFKARYAGISSLLRGSRSSVAVLSGHQTKEQLAALSDDIWAYSGLGCRNVSLIFLPEGCELKLQMPTMNAKYRNNYVQTRTLLAMTGQSFVDLGTAVALEQCAFPTALSQIAYAHYRTIAEVEAWLSAHDTELQCVVSECVQHSRCVRFGCAQAPTLTDYADEKDVIAFLVALN